jgi:hypothetical protein
MEYPEEFKKRVLLIFDGDEMRNRLEQGQEFVGRILDESCCDGVSLKEIVDAYESGNFEGLYQKAKRKLAIKELYSEWCQMHREQYGLGRHR